jgi:YVTN family beta-propeller protein
MSDCILRAQSPLATRHAQCQGSPEMPDLPSGAVTFLFTDIEGSTRLVKQLRERYGEVLQEHQRLLRAAFEAHDGHEVDTQGDSFFVVFANARDALLAAVEGQLALLSHPWPEGVQIKVRMGLHTGQVVVSGGRYTGLAVHRAARIGAAGHGGQVLVSQTTRTLLEDEEEDLRVFLRDLGDQRLKDLDRPVRLYQAEADGLPASFPPLRHEAEIPEAAETAIRPNLFRRPGVIVALGLALAALIAAAAVLATRNSSHGLSGVRPNYVGIIDATNNQIVDEQPVGPQPGPVAIGDGSVWVGNLGDRSLTRIDERRRESGGSVPLNGLTPTGLVVGYGYVWVVHGRSGQLSRIDSQFPDQKRTRHVATRNVTSQNGGVTAGDGAVWAVYGDSTIAQIQRSLRMITAFGGGAPAAVVVGSGSLWVANSENDTVDRFSLDTFTEGPIAMVPVGTRPTAMTFGQGFVWVADTDADAVTQIDPLRDQPKNIPVGHSPRAIAFGAGAVWVANAGSGTVSRIDPATSKVKSIDVGNAPWGIAVHNGLVWVSVRAP